MRREPLKPPSASVDTWRVTARRPLIVLLTLVLGCAVLVVVGDGVQAKRAQDKQARFTAASAQLTQLVPPHDMTLVKGEPTCPPQQGSLCLLATADPQKAARALVPVLSDPHVASVTCQANGHLETCVVRGWYAGERAVATCISHWVLPRGPSGTPLKFSGTDVRLAIARIY